MGRQKREYFDTDAVEKGINSNSSCGKVKKVKIEEYVPASAARASQPRAGSRGQILVV